MERGGGGGDTAPEEVERAGHQPQEASRSPRLGPSFCFGKSWWRQVQRTGLLTSTRGIVAQGVPGPH